MTLRKSIAVTLGVLAVAPASAHISYSGRDFGTIGVTSNVTIATQTVSGNWGWADASDQSLAFNSDVAWHTVDGSAFASATFANGVDNLYFGDSHKGKAFRFTLAGTQTLTITATARATATIGADLAPAFSVYQGLAAVSPFTPPQTSADHDFAVASRDWRTYQVQSVTGNTSLDYWATQGSWNALGNWSIGGDGDTSTGLDLFQYVGSAATTVHNGVASGTFTLGAGSYTIFVGGDDITTKSAANSAMAYGVTLNVAAVPEPETYAMMLAGLGMVGFAGRRRRRTV